jgi:hypothetical protein
MLVRASRGCPTLEPLPWVAAREKQAFSGRSESLELTLKGFHVTAVRQLF